MSKKIMIDLETLDTTTGAAIVSIGATKFDERGVHWDHFYQTIQWSQQDGVISRETLTWWLSQPPAVQAALTDTAAILLAPALIALQQWMGSEAEVWAGPATFDIPILQRAFEQASIPVPWAFYSTRCYSTLRKLNPDIKRVASAIPHNALEDAIAQAEHAVQLLWPVKREAARPLDVEAAAWDYVDPRNQLHRAMPENIGATAGARAHFQNGIKFALAHHAMQPGTESTSCTCPSGDGSLTWPCPAHPSGK